MTRWELIVLWDIEEHGARFFGSGSGALFDAAAELVRRGELRVVYRAGVPYVELPLEGDGGPAVEPVQDPFGE